MDVAIRPHSEREKEQARESGIFDSFGFLTDSGVEVSTDTREHIYRDGWAQMVAAGSQVCETTSAWDPDKPEALDEDRLLALNDQARRLARSTQTLLAIAREEKGR